MNQDGHDSTGNSRPVVDELEGTKDQVSGRPRLDVAHDNDAVNVANFGDQGVDDKSGLQKKSRDEHENGIVIKVN